MGLVLGFDLETTGVDTRTAWIVELAAVLYDTTRKRAVKSFCTLVKWDGYDNFEFPEEAQKICNIKPEDLAKYGLQAEFAIAEFFDMAKDAEFIVGHNVMEYDAKVLETCLHRIHGAEIYDTRFYKLRYIDTYIDLPLAPGMQFTRLKYMAIDHGYVLNDAHTALADVFGCLHLLGRYDWETIKAIASTPLVTISARVQYDDWGRKEKLRGARFYWNRDLKMYQKTIRRYWADQLKSQLAFDVTMEEKPISVMPLREQAQLSLLGSDDSAPSKIAPESAGSPLPATPEQGQAPS